MTAIVELKMPTKAVSNGMNEEKSFWMMSHGNSSMILSHDFEGGNGPEKINPL